MTPAVAPPITTTSCVSIVLPFLTNLSAPPRRLPSHPACGNRGHGT
jgi:hypothetical protein